MKLILVRRFLRLPVAGRDGATVSAYRRALGYQQLTLSGSAQFLTLPTLTGAKAGLSVSYAVIQCEGAAGTDFGRWRDDGTDPTASIGMKLFSGQELDYAGDIALIKFITGSGSPVLNISYYM